MTQQSIDLPVSSSSGGCAPERLTGPEPRDLVGDGPVRTPRVIGLDLSLTATGIASALGVCLVESTGRKGATLTERSRRLADLRTKILRCIDVSQDVTPDLVVLEGPAYSSRDGQAHDRSGLWWMVVRALHVNGIPVAIVSTNQRMLYATGKGRADKDEVLAAAVKRYPAVDIRNNNTADAYVLYAMGCDHLGFAPAKVPAKNREPIDKIDWPVIAA